MRQLTIGKVARFGALRQTCPREVGRRANPSPSPRTDVDEGVAGLAGRRLAHRSVAQDPQSVSRSIHAAAKH
jgi:hypothetical protein